MRTEICTSRQRKLQLLAATVVVVTTVGILSLTAEAKHTPRFSNASLYGQYAVQSIGDDHVSVGLGIVKYDGRGHATRRILVNAPDGAGGRRFLVFESTGEYSVNPDGTGVAVFDNEISNGAMTRTTFDFVITETEGVSPRSRGSKLARALYSAQQEAGETVSLVTNVQTRQ